jgi:hypothetical protein
MIEEGLVALLQANNGGDAIDTYVTPAGGIFGDDAPPDLASMPCITYAFVGGSSDPTSNTSGVLRQRVELNAQVVNPANSLSPRAIAGKIRRAIILRVNGWQENNVGGDGTNVLNAVLLNPGTDFVTEERIFRMMCEFYVLYTLPL